MALFSLADAKAWIGIDPSDTTRDVILTSLVNAASEACVKVMGRDPLRRTHTETVSGKGGPALPVNNFPISSVSSVTINSRYGGTPMPSTQYTWDDNCIYHLGGVFPFAIRNVDLIYIAGLYPCPEPITLAAKYTCKGMWDARLIDMNSTGENWSEVGGSSFWPTGPGAVPPQARQYLDLYASRIKV